MGVEVVDVAGGDQREPRPLGQGHQPVQQAQVARVVVVLQLDEEPVGPKQTSIAPGRLQRPLELLLRQQTHDLPPAAAGKPDQPLGVIGQDPASQPGRPLGLVPVSQSEQPAQVGVAPPTLGQEGEVAIVLQRHLRPQDRLDASFLGRAHKADRSVQPVVVCQGQRRHPALRRLSRQLLWSADSIQQAVAGMGVEFDVFGGRHPQRCLRSSHHRSLSTSRKKTRTCLSAVSAR